MTNIWEDYQLEEKIRSILDVFTSNPEHHFDRPFLTSYQIAIIFKERYPEIFGDINMPLGGKGTGSHNSFAQYIANILSRRIKNDTLTDIEGRFLHMDKITELIFNDSGSRIEANDQADISMYRLLN
ncbi:hypothetical protein KQH62_00015 [bacterium]|nr:hypothetical protein [bacterium]